MGVRRWGLVGALLLALCVVLPANASVTAAADVCDDAPLPAPALTVKVLVMGDSLSQQFAGDYTWRYRFWQAERAQGVNIDFVGPYTGLLATWDTDVVNNTDYADPCFTQIDHFAVGSKDLAATLQPPAWDPTATSEVAWATAYYQPDVVLGFMGYNDLKPYDPTLTSPPNSHHGYTASQLLANVLSSDPSAKTFVSEAQGAKPGVPVGIATVLSTKAPDIVVNATPYNTMLEAAVARWTADNPADPVGVVDVTKDWLGAPADTWDGYHPNAQGEMHLAWDIADGLHTLVPGIATLDRPIPPVAMGPQTAPTVKVTDATSTSVTLAVGFPVGANIAIPYESDAGSSWVKLPEFGEENDSKSTTINGLGPHLYQFRVQVAKGTALAADVSGQPLYSEPVSVDLRPFSPIASDSVRAAYHGATLSWSPVAVASGYQVRWRRTGTRAWTLRTTSATSYAVTGLLGGADYDFTVTPLRDQVQGTTTPVVSRIALGTVSPAGKAPRVSRLARHRVRVGWVRAAHATRYQVLIRSNGGRWHTLGWTTGLTLTSGRLVTKRHYAVAVVAWDSYVAGSRSAATAFTGR